MDTCICMAESLSYHCLSAILQYKITSCFCVFFLFFFLKNVGENCATGRRKSKEKGSEMPMSLACSGNNEKAPVWLEPHGGHRKKKEGR